MILHDPRTSIYDRSSVLGRLISYGCDLCLTFSVPLSSIAPSPSTIPYRLLVYSTAILYNRTKPNRLLPSSLVRLFSSALNSHPYPSPTFLRPSLRLTLPNRRFSYPATYSLLLPRLPTLTGDCARRLYRPLIRRLFPAVRLVPIDSVSLLPSRRYSPTSIPPIATRPPPPR